GATRSAAVPPEADGRVAPRGRRSAHLMAVVRAPRDDRSVRAKRHAPVSIGGDGDEAVARRSSAYLPANVRAPRGERPVGAERDPMRLTRRNGDEVVARRRRLRSKSTGPPELQAAIASDRDRQRESDRRIGVAAASRRAADLSPKITAPRGEPAVRVKCDRDVAPRDELGVIDYGGRGRNSPYQYDVLL